MKELILEAWNNRELLKDSKYSDAVRGVIEELDKGYCVSHRRQLTNG
jgi:2,3,4,5-tetrahydropyridine-2-carboxylate N-succinyltransferase